MVIICCCKNYFITYRVVDNLVMVFQYDNVDRYETLSTIYIEER